MQIAALYGNEYKVEIEADEMVARADAALYTAKRTGRNRTMSGELLSDARVGAA